MREAIRFARFLSGCVAALLIVSTPPVAFAEAPGRGAPAVRSPEVRPDRRVTFRIAGAGRTKGELRSPGDIPGGRRPRRAPMQLTKNAEGVWETTVGPLPAGAYRYVFVVNGVTVVDSRNPLTSQTNTTVYSLAVVPGSEVFDTKNVPHGAVASVHYYSTALGGTRRMHVYTPPGYESGPRSLSGAVSAARRRRRRRFVDVGRPRRLHPRQPDRGEQGEADDRRDAGRSRQRRRRRARCAGPGRRGAGESRHRAGPDPFVTDFMTDIVPYVEKNYRVLTDRQSRAIAGLSMGGNQTLNIAIPQLEQFGYIGVFSSGIPRRAGAAVQTPRAVRRSVGEAEPRGARQRCRQGGPLAPVVQHRQGRWSDHDDERARWSCSRSTGSSRCSSRARARTRGSTGATICRCSRRSCFTERSDRSCDLHRSS